MRLAASVGALLLVSSPVARAQDVGTPPAQAPATGAPAGKPDTKATAPAPVRPVPLASELAGQTPREIRFRGNTQVSSEELLRLMSTRPGHPIDPAQLERDLTGLEEEYHRRGFILMRALSPDPLSPDGVLTIPIQEGRIESIEVVGNKKTRRWVILRQMETRPEMVYNERIVRDDRQRLANLGI